MNILLWYLCFISALSFSNADYTLQIRAISYKNSDNEDYKHNCCDFSFIGCGTCDVYFKFCVRAKGTTPTNDNCWYSKQTNDDKSATTINFPTNGELYSGADVDNPITFNRDGSWPGSFQLMIRIKDSDTDADDLVDRIIYNMNLSPSSEWTGTITGDAHYNEVTFKAQFRVTCQSNYYTSSCSVYCKKRDNNAGHYDCGSSGQKICKSGWSNPSTSCITPICASGCSDEGGYCSSPGQCLCNNGWTGTNCNECIPSSGCSTNHGHCEGPYTCVCESGYGGNKCKQDLDVCGHQHPCQHEGMCTNNGADAYTCSCLLGYTGTDCETNINECNPDPCLNGGICNDQINGFMCECKAGFTGEHCETNINDCSEDLCQNGGTCTDLVNGYSCTCPVGFLGPNCEGHQCDSSPCDNGGTCLMVTEGYKCACAAGYNGTNCDVDINECDPSPCINSTDCHDLIADYKCDCIAGFTGKDCNININECNSSQCSYNSDCVDGIDSYTCLCDYGYTGQYCDDVILYCNSSTCLNGGTCNDYIGYYVCNCPAGFTGINCEINIDDCSPNPCSNGGTCSDMVRSFVCTCPTGFTGLTCDTTVDPCDTNPCQIQETCVGDIVDERGFICIICLDDICGDVEKVFGNYTSPLPTSKPASEPVNGDIELMIGLIVGGVLLLLCLCCLTICLCCVCYKKKKRTETRDACFVSTDFSETRTENPTYIPPDLLASSCSSSMQRSDKQLDGDTLLAVTNPLYNLQQTNSSQPQSLKNPSKSGDMNQEVPKLEGGLRAGIRRSLLLQTGEYDKLNEVNAIANENIYLIDSTDSSSLPNQGITKENSCKNSLDTDTPPTTVNNINPYDTLPTENTYDVIPAPQEDSNSKLPENDPGIGNEVKVNPYDYISHYQSGVNEEGLYEDIPYFNLDNQ